MPKFFSSLRVKLALIVVAAVVVAMLIAAISHGSREAARRYEAMKSELHGMAATLAMTVAPAQAAGQYRQVQSVLRAVRHMKRVKYVRVSDKAGRSVASFGSGIVLQRDTAKVKADEYVGLFDLLSLKTFPVDMPIMDGGLRVGTLTLIGDVSELGVVFNSSLFAALLGGLVAAMLGILVAVKMQRIVTRPIRRLTRAMREVQQSNDFTQRVPRTSSDETGDLTDAFNDMLGQIRSRDLALSRHRETLEETVEERTRDLHEATEEAQQASAAKSDFLATMSHEIRTPMNGMLVMAELLSAGELPPRLRRYTEVIVSSGQSLLSIINDILDLSKVEAGRMELEAIPVAPRQLADHVTRLYAERAQSKGIDIAAIVDPDVPQSVAADPVRLNQILSNLVNNALKFTETGGVLVHIGLVERNGCAPQDGTVELSFSVRDSGIGIAKDKLAHVFDSFSQADQSTTRKYGGTGIGLSICQRLVICMGGSISVESEEGMGTTFGFCVEVPVLGNALSDDDYSYSPISEDQCLRMALAMPDNPTREALAVQMRRAGVEPVIINLKRNKWKVPANVVAVVAQAASVADLVQSKKNVCPVIALAGLGSSEADGLISRKEAAAALTWPISADEVEIILSRLASNEPLHSEDSNRAGDAVQQEVASFAGVHVLAADDSIVNREVLSEALHRLDIKVTCVDDGHAALEAVKNETFDLVFMDGSMPVMDGFEATREIRTWEEDNGRSPTPVVALTAHVIGAQSELWRDAGMTDCVTKPFTLKMIEECLLRWLADRVSQRHESIDRSAPVAAPDASAGCRVEADEIPLTDEVTLGNIAQMQSIDSGLVARVVGLYIEHAPPTLAAIEKAVEDECSDEIASSAHALKSLSLNIGASRVAHITGSIEDEARQGQAHVSDAVLANLQAALDETLPALSRATQLPEDQEDAHATQSRSAS